MKRKKITLKRREDMTKDDDERVYCIDDMPYGCLLVIGIAVAILLCLS